MPQKFRRTPVVVGALFILVAAACASSSDTDPVETKVDAAASQGGRAGGSRDTAPAPNDEAGKGDTGVAGAAAGAVGTDRRDAAPSSSADTASTGDGAPNPAGDTAGPTTAGKHVIIDTDADNEVDDQHAIAYALINADAWTVDGITTNHTVRPNAVSNTITQDTQEAQRIVDLLGLKDKVKVYQGVGGKNSATVPDPAASFDSLKSQLDQPQYEGKAAVDFIVARAQNHSPENKLVLIPIGKLTNIALALAKDPTIVPKVRVLWLGSNYPGATDEHNERHDYSSVNALMNGTVEFDIATVRYGGNGTSRVVMSKGDSEQKVKGKGPQIAPAVSGRSGGSFTRVGDYLYDLFNKSGSGSRAMFDLAAVALEKNRTWATAKEEGAPVLERQGGGWVWTKRPNNTRKVKFYESFKSGPILEDFYGVMASPKLP